MPLPPQKSRNRIPLSRQDLCAISQIISRDFSPRVFCCRVNTNSATVFFSSHELLEIGRQISREYAPSLDARQSELVLLSISPKRLHAYWHLTPGREEEFEAQHLHRQTHSMTLRIYPQSVSAVQARPSEENDALLPWFDVAVSGQSGHQDIMVPESLQVAAQPLQFSAVLGDTLNGNEFVPYLYSDAAASPWQVPTDHGERLVNAIARFIMPELAAAPFAGKTASGQGKSNSR